MRTVPAYKQLSMSLLLSAGFIALISSCATTSSVKGGPHVPGVQEQSPTVAALESTVNIPLELKTWYLEGLLNKNLPDLLYQYDSLNLGSFKNVGLRVWKTDSITLSLNGDELAYRVPMRIQLRFSQTVGALGLSHTEYQDVEASIALSFKSRLFVNNNWNVVSMTRYERYEWLSDPVVKVRFISIPIRPVADMLLSKQGKLFEALVDSAVCNYLDIKKLLYPLWMSVQRPLLLTPAPDSVWLSLAPQGIYMTQLRGNSGRISASVGIRTIASTTIGPRPRVALRDSLPNFTIPGALDSSFIVNLHARLPYESASAMLRSYINGRSFKSGRREVIILNATVYGIDGYAVVELDLTGSLRGKVYVIGSVDYDPRTMTLSIDNLDFDMSTKSALHSTADWLLHDVVRTKLKPYLRFPIREKLLESQLMVQKMLSHRPIAQDVYLRGVIDSLSIGGVQLGDSAIETMVRARGSLNIVVHD